LKRGHRRSGGAGHVVVFTRLAVRVWACMRGADAARPEVRTAHVEQSRPHFRRALVARAVRPIHRSTSCRRSRRRLRGGEEARRPTGGSGRGLGGRGSRGGRARRGGRGRRGYALLLEARSPGGQHDVAQHAHRLVRGPQGGPDEEDRDEGRGSDRDGHGRCELITHAV